MKKIITLLIFVFCCTLAYSNNDTIKIDVRKLLKFDTINGNIIGYYSNFIIQGDSVIPVKGHSMSPVENASYIDNSIIGFEINEPKVQKNLVEVKVKDSIPNTSKTKRDTTTKTKDAISVCQSKCSCGCKTETSLSHIQLSFGWMISVFVLFSCFLILFLLYETLKGFEDETLILYIVVAWFVYTCFILIMIAIQALIS